ncbi:hypothetical protein A4D02_23485 [Niastella koreensis]|uniref:Tissue inhibitor of metalloproteinase n=2 Tax=Niastella koreensis TaxID=354356 RepID=G8TAV1_NIAKG|nr:hypothetical protein [Niastella koreensis]AEW00294.1 hypothetical protein Niako_4014 [Niastella koreensis GR20-10]OQP52162.1 hypothetical protein A4D02_23485 [Niastella koreensis]
MILRMNKQLALTLFSICFHFITASACDCIMHPVEKYVDTSKYIVTVKVKKLISPDVNGQSGKAILVITQSLKGTILKSQEIETDADGSDCSLTFQMNKRYLLFGNFNNSKFYVYHCSYSDEIKYSKKRIRRIRKYLKSKDQL